MSYKFKKINKKTKRINTLNHYYNYDRKPERNNYYADLKNSIARESDEDTDEENKIAENLISQEETSQCGTCRENGKKAADAIEKYEAMKEKWEQMDYDEILSSNAALQKNVNNLSAKYEKSKEKLHRLMHLFTESQLKLRNMVNAKGPSSSLEPSDDNVATASFNPRELTRLLNIPVEQKYDSTFVRVALHIIYGNDSTVLMNRSVKGLPGRTRNCNGSMKIYPAKPALTPEKMKQVRSQYNMRIQANCADSTDFNKRISDTYFNKLINNALSNESKKEKYELYDVIV